MRLFETHRELLTTAIWMISLPLIFAFLAGAGAGTFLDSVARFAGTVWSIYGGASLILGVLLLGWVLFSDWRRRSKAMNG